MTFDPNDPIIANRTTQTFTVRILMDLFVESDETIQLTLSNVSTNATYGVNRTAILTILDAPPVLTVTPVSNPICAGGRHTPIHQTVVNVSLTDGTYPFVGIPLTLSTDHGSLADVTGVTDSNGTFTTTLTSNHWASGSLPYKATVTVVANGILTQTAQVEFGPTVVALSSDVTTIPPGGEAKLTALLTFQGNFVANHRLRWRIAGIWDDSDKPKQVYNGTGAIPSGYGRIKAGASRRSDSNGLGSAILQSGTKKGKVEIQAGDKSVRMTANGDRPHAAIALSEGKTKLIIKRKQDGEKEYKVITDANREVLPGEFMDLEIFQEGSTDWKWMIPSLHFQDYATTNEKGTLSLLEAADKKKKTITFYWTFGDDKDREVVAKRRTWKPLTACAAPLCHSWRCGV